VAAPPESWYVAFRSDTRTSFCTTVWRLVLHNLAADALVYSGIAGLCVQFTIGSGRVVYLDEVLWPCTPERSDMTTDTPNEHAASGTGAMTPLFHAGRPSPAAAQHEREATTTRTKSIIASFLFGIALLQASAADDPLIPAPLNAVLLKIQPGMSTNQVLALLSPSYPKVAGQMGTWSGQTGYFDYKLDDRFTLKVSCVMRHGKELVHDDLLFYVFDWKTKRRVDIKLYYWDGQSHKEPPKT
jgi:hypothetical protein